MRLLWIGIGCLLAAIAIALIAGGIWIRSYLRSDAFRQLIANRTGNALKADVSLTPLSWSGSTVFSQQLTANGLPQSPLESGQADGVRAAINWKAILDGAWRVDSIDIERMDAVFKPAVRPDTAEAAGAEVPPAKRGGILPTRFELKEVRVQQANLKLPGFGDVEKTTVAARPEGTGWLIDGSGGDFTIEDRPPMQINSWRLRVQKSALYITEADLRMGRNGAVSASGEVADKTFNLLVEWQRVDAADLLDETWGKRLTGLVSGEARSTGEENNPPVTTGKFLLVDGILKGLPLQSSIATFTNSPQFERIPIHEVSGDFTHQSDATDVSDFVLESRGLIRVEGNCRIESNDAMDGTFEVGVTSQTLRWLPGSQERVFTKARDGYQWTTVHVTGTTAHPKEDLSRRLLRAAGEEVIESGLEVIEQVPDNANDVIDKAVDILTPLIP